MSTSATANARPSARPCSTAAADGLHQRTVIESPGQRVEPGGIDERAVWRLMRPCAARKTKNSTAARRVPPTA